MLQAVPYAPAVTIAVAKKPGTNAVELVTDLDERLVDLYGPVIPANMQVTKTRDYGFTAGEKSSELIKHLWIATLAVVMAMPYTHQVQGHIGVEILVRLFSEKTQTIIDICTGSISLILFAIVTWRMTVYADTMKKSGEVSMNLELPEHLSARLARFHVHLDALAAALRELTVQERAQHLLDGPASVHQLQQFL